MAKASVAALSSASPEKSAENAEAAAGERTRMAWYKDVKKHTPKTVSESLPEIKECVYVCVRRSVLVITSSVISNKREARVRSAILRKAVSPKLAYARSILTSFPSHSGEWKFTENVSSLLGILISANDTYCITCAKKDTWQLYRHSVCTVCHITQQMAIGK